MVLLESVPLFLVFIATALVNDSTGWNLTALGLDPFVLVTRSWASSCGGVSVFHWRVVPALQSGC